MSEGKTILAFLGGAAATLIGMKIKRSMDAKKRTWTLHVEKDGSAIAYAPRASLAASSPWFSSKEEAVEWLRQQGVQSWGSGTIPSHSEAEVIT